MQCSYCMFFIFIIILASGKTFCSVSLPSMFCVEKLEVGFLFALVVFLVLDIVGSYGQMRTQLELQKLQKPRCCD